MQTTLESSITFSGIGLHSGLDVTLTLKPAPENHGILFERRDIQIGNPIVRARWDYVSETTLCTKLMNEDGTARLKVGQIAQNVFKTCQIQPFLT